MKRYYLVDLDKDHNKNDKCTTAVEFDAGLIENKKYGTVNMKGHVLCVKPLSTFTNVDKKNISCTEQECIDWAVTHNLIKEDNKYYEKFSKVRFAYFSAYTVPGIKLKNMKIYWVLMIFLFCLDDIVDNVVDHRTKTDFSYNQLSLAVDIFIGILHEKYKNMDDIPDINFPLYGPLCKTLFEFRHLLHELVYAFELDPRPTIKANLNYLKAVVWEQREHDDHFPSQETYFFRRLHTAAILPCLELIALLHRITLSEEMRENLFMQRFMEAASHHAFLINDVLSLSKEMSTGETENIVLIKQEELGLQKAFDSALHLLNNEILEISRLGNELRKLFPDDSNLLGYVDSVENFSDGDLYWYIGSKRYGDTKFITKKVIFDE